MKRIVALLTVIAVLALGCVPAFAATGDVFTFSGVEGDTCAPGSTVTIAIGLVENTNLSAMNMEVSYDTDTFEYVSYENGDIISNSVAIGNCTKGKFLFALATLTPINEKGSLFTITFKVDANAKGDHSFFVYSTGFSDENGNEMPANTLKKVITVKGEAASDVSVTPVYSTNDTGSTYVVSATEDPTDPITAPNQYSGTTSDGNGSSSDKGEGGNGMSVWVIVAIAVLGIGAVALLAAAFVSNKKAKTPVEHQSILDDQGKAMLGYEENNEN